MSPGESLTFSCSRKRPETEGSPKAWRTNLTPLQGGSVPAESQVRLLLWLGEGIMLLHLLTKHMALVTWCKLVSNPTVLHLIILFMELCENNAFNGERKDLKFKILMNRCVKKPAA